MMALCLALGFDVATQLDLCDQAKQPCPVELDRDARQPRDLIAEVARGFRRGGAWREVEPRSREQQLGLVRLGARQLVARDGEIASSGPRSRLRDCDRG